MQKLPEIKATYDWFFARYTAEIAERARKNDIAGIDQMEARRDILERGIFILMFGQFEKAVTSVFEDAMNVRAANPDWSRRRGWDTSSLKGKKVPFDTIQAKVRGTGVIRRISSSGRPLHHGQSLSPRPA